MAANARINPKERVVLQQLIEVYGYTGDKFWFTHFKPIMEATGLSRSEVRRACRSLRRKGLAEYSRGLWADDGQPAGAGYAATPAGRKALEDLAQ